MTKRVGSSRLCDAGAELQQLVNMVGSVINQVIPMQRFPRRNPLSRHRHNALWKLSDAIESNTYGSDVKRLC